jgi:RNA polymerase sigma factor (sigma-70 family)
MKCYRCQAQLPADAKFCGKCGAPQEFTEELIQKAIQGNQESITELYNRTYNNVYFTVKSMVKDEDTILDIVQDTYVKAFKSLGQLQEAGKFKAWIKKIAHNKTVDYLRKTKPVLFSEMVSADSDEMIDFEDNRKENRTAGERIREKRNKAIFSCTDSIFIIAFQESGCICSADAGTDCFTEYIICNSN